MRTKTISFLTAAFLMLPVLPALADNPSCTITGTIMTLEKIEKSAWSDGAPSPFSTIEIQMSVRIDTRGPYKNAPASDAAKCTTTAGEIRTYKLCAPTPVKQGDVVQGTEASGLTTNINCLFDIAVRQPDKTQP